MFGLVLKDVESKYNRINKWLFIYKQQELLLVTGRKLNPEMINSVCSTVSGRVLKTDRLDRSPIIIIIIKKNPYVTNSCDVSFHDRVQQ